MKKEDKLFTVWSPMPSFNSWKGRGTSVFWYRADKPRDGFQYGEIIKGYNDMTEEDKRLHESCVNKLFTSDEVKALRHFVETELERELFVDFEIDLSQPLSEQECNVSGGDYSEDDSIYLNQMEGYNLPFEVRGIYFPEEGDPVIKHWSVDKFKKPAKK
jgi:hypothetical protein